jgi:hypothetical protein
MAGQEEPSAKAYRLRNDLRWTEIAYDMLVKDDPDLRGEIVSHEDVIRSRVWGPCPYCGHDLDDRQTHTAVANLMGTERRGIAPDETERDVEPRFFAVDISCSCMVPHPGAPAGTAGCGVSFRVELPLQVHNDS